jgi:hypothetical protein
MRDQRHEACQRPCARCLPICRGPDSAGHAVVGTLQPMTSPHTFDQAIALTPTAEGEYTGATSPAYANMVGPFGGVTAAVALNAVLQHPPRCWASRWC